MLPIIIFIIIGLLILFLLIAVFIKKEKRPIDYYSFFIMGLIWLVFGLIFDIDTLTIMGIVFTVTGVVNKNKWKKNRRTWKDMTKQERNMQMIAIGAGTIILLLGILAYFLVSRGVI